MIEISHLTKSYGDVKAVNDVTLSMGDGEVFGLLGTNGAGKSTLLRLVTGILRPDAGEITVDGEPVIDNPSAKRKLFFISDDAWFFPTATCGAMCAYYRDIYPSFDEGRFTELMEGFGLDKRARVQAFSKGMKKQLLIILALSSGAKYLLCDETFDGLDPVVRQGVKSLLARDMTDRGLVPIIASHNLRELEDICDHVGLLHRGGVLLSEDLSSMKLGLQKVQVVFGSDEDREMALRGLQVILAKNQGRLYTYTIRGSREEVESRFSGVGAVFFESLPLTLEEMFISETEVAGYDIGKHIFE